MGGCVGVRAEESDCEVRPMLRSALASYIAAGKERAISVR